MTFSKLRTSVAIAALLSAPLTANALVLSTGNVLDYADGISTSNSKGTSYGTLAEGSIDGGFVVDFEGGFEGDFEGPEPGLTPVAFATDVNGNTVTQQDLLGPITGESTHYDPVQLDIEFLADEGVDSITFFATFGSEEFPEFQDSQYNDGFGLFVNGVNTAGVQTSGGGENLPVNISHPDMVAFDGTELDGVLAPNGNPVLQFDVGNIVAGQANTFTIILADAGDSSYDTTTYISSFIPTSIIGGGTGNPSVNDGGTEFTPLLPDPSNPVDQVTGAFVIELPVTESGIFDPETTIWVDPPYAIGYTYSVSGGALIETITAPSGATVPNSGAYTVTANGITKTLGVSETASIFDLFGVTGVSFVEVGGIDEGLADSQQFDAFPFGLNLSGPSGSSSVTVTPIIDNLVIAPIPLPAGAALYLSGLAFAGFAGRRLKKARKS